MRFRVLAYQGLAWLHDLGTFDSFDEAQAKLMDAKEHYCSDDEIGSGGYCANEEAFLFSSRIEEVKNDSV